MVTGVLTGMVTGMVTGTLVQPPPPAPAVLFSLFLVCLLVWHIWDEDSCRNKGLGLQSVKCPWWF